MKKWIMVCAALLMVAAIFATESQGSWASSAEDGVDKSGDSATMKVSFDLNSEDDEGEKVDENASVKIGFTSAAVSSLTASVTPTPTATLKTENGKGVLEEDRYIYWQIAASTGMTIDLSWDEKMEGSKDDNELVWTITTTASTSTGDGVANGDSITSEKSNYQGVTVLDRSDLTKFKYGTVGSQELTIETVALSSAAIDNYSGTLKLTVKSTT